MNAAGLKLISRRPPVIIAVLLTVAILAFLGVSRLVYRFHEQEKALARHLYDRGLEAQVAGNAEAALGDFRAALGYSRDNFQYQLSLARALRDTGRTAEAEAYLISLWERTPQDGAVNLALGRLFARERSFDRAIQYYHNAIYGLWASEAEAKRRDAQLELIEFLLQHEAYPQAQAELITMSPSLPANPSLRLRVADLFLRAHDDEHALVQYQGVAQNDPGNQAALFGAGRAAFQAGRYRTAQAYLQSVVRSDPQNAQAHPLLETTVQVLQSDPFAPRISDHERIHRMRAAFFHAGDRLDHCASCRGIDLSRQLHGTGLSSLKARWLEMKPKLASMPASGDGLLDRGMDLVFEIERESQAECGSPDGWDQALLLLSQAHAGVER